MRNDLRQSLRTFGLAWGVFSLGWAGMAAADDATNDAPTYTKDVLPIMQKNCQDCHRSEGQNLSGVIAPMALMTYEETRPYAKSIAKSVKAKEMPPWRATEEFHGVFKNERTLSEKEINTIVSWAQAGAPMGRPEDAPPPRVFNSVDGWSIGKPDLIVTFDKPFFVKDEVWDLYQHIPVKLTEDMLPEDKFIKALEFKPGSRAVHHIIAYARAAEAKGMDMERGMIGGMAPGTDPANMPEGYGIPLKKGSTIIFQMHYHKEKGPGTGVSDQSQIGLIFHKTPVKHVLVIDPISNGRFEIPPGASNWKVGMARTFEKDILITSLLPHTHLRGKAAKYVAYYPDGTEEKLLEVPNYDFNWQIDYMFKQPKHIPAGTRIEATLWYDNSAERTKLAPEVDPTKPIRFGGPTTDEMDLAWMTYTTLGGEKDKEVGAETPAGSAGPGE